jgi:hypothetical protein
LDFSGSKPNNAQKPGEGKAIGLIFALKFQALSA